MPAGESARLQDATPQARRLACGREGTKSDALSLWPSSPSLGVYQFIAARDALYLRGAAIVFAAAGLEQLGDQAGPAGLVRRADAAPSVAVEILVKQNVIPKLRV